MSETLELKPIAVDLDNWTPTPNSGKWALIDDHLLDPGTANADYIEGMNPPSATLFDTYFFEALAGDDSDRVVRVVLGIRIATTSSESNLVLYPLAHRGTIDAVPPSIALPDIPAGPDVFTYRDILVDFTSYRPGGGTWEIADFGSGSGKVSFGLAANYTLFAHLVHVPCLWLPVTKQPVGVLLPAVRRAASVAAWRGRMIPVLAKASLGTGVGGALELGDDIYASDHMAPTPEGAGWGVGIDEARPLQVRGLDEDLTRHLVDVEALVLRGQVVLFADSGRTIGVARAPNGITRLEQGGVSETFERSSKDYVDQPDGLVGEVLFDEPALGKAGRAHQGAATNDCFWSSFQVGNDWASLGTSTFVTDEALFTPEVAARVFNVPSAQAPVMPGIDLRTGWTVLSVDYRTLTGATAALRIKRASDDKYYDVANDAWGTVVDNALPAAAVRARHFVRINQPDAATTYSLFLVSIDGTVRWFHVQSEEARKGIGWPSSRIVTRDAALAREHSYLELSNDTGERTWPGQDGTVRLRWQPNFSAHDAEGGGAFTLWRCEIDATTGDEMDLHYVPPADEAGQEAGQGLLELSVTTGGGTPTTYTVGLDLEVAAGNVYRIAARWQARAQNGDAPGTISVWCEDVAVRAAGPGDAIVFAAASIVVRGGSDNTDGSQAEGFIWDEISESFVLSDGELEEW